MTIIHNTYIFDYIFGDRSGHAGIGCISGDAGCTVDVNMSQSDFEGNVEAYLGAEHEDRNKEVAVMRAEFADQETRDDLFSYFQHFNTQNQD